MDVLNDLKNQLHSPDFQMDQEDEAKKTDETKKDDKKETTEEKHSDDDKDIDPHEPEDMRWYWGHKADDMMVKDMDLNNMSKEEIDI